jgi:hypothetical protein
MEQFQMDVCLGLVNTMRQQEVAQIDLAAKVVDQVHHAHDLRMVFDICLDGTKKQNKLIELCPMVE